MISDLSIIVKLERKRGQIHIEIYVVRQRAYIHRNECQKIHIKGLQ